MKHLIIVGLCSLVLVAGIAATPAAHAEVATTTAATTTVATTTVATTTVATTTPVVSSTTPSVSSHIAGLLAQLAKLTALFNELKAKLMGVQTQITELKSDLREGMTDADIKAIQEALASDPTIYPGGFKTGYFGPLTVEAIKRFQAKNDLEVTGTINAETKAALDTIMAQRRSEGHFPMGLLIAPGQHRDDFENRVRTNCGITSASSTVAVPCIKFKEKYKFEIDDKGRMKMKMEVKKDDKTHASSSDESEDSDNSEDSDDSHSN